MAAANVSASPAAPAPILGAQGLSPAVPATAGTPMSDLARRIDAALPQTQCTRCGYPDCAAYARAVAAGEAGINQCPPAALTVSRGCRPSPACPWWRSTRNTASSRHAPSRH